MALYYPHLCNGDGYLENTEGEEFADDLAAHAGAIRIIRELIAAEVVEGVTINLAHFIEMRDSQGRVLERVYFSDAVRFETGAAGHAAAPVASIERMRRRVMWSGAGRWPRLPSLPFGRS